MSDLENYEKAFEEGYEDLLELLDLYLGEVGYLYMYFM